MMCVQRDSQYMLVPGQFVFSKAGHDKGKLYVIIKTDGSKVYVADGRLKTLEHLKCKNIRHVQRINEYMCPADAFRLEELKNEDIKRAIKLYMKRCGNEESV